MATKESNWKAFVRVWIVLFLWLIADCKITNAVGLAFAVAPAPLTQASAFVEENRGFEEEHEANGPEGSRGVPMQSMSKNGILCALIILLSGASLALSTSRNPASRGGKDKNG